MELIIFAAIVLILLCLAIWVLTLFPMLPPMPKMILQALFIIAAIYVVGQRAALW